MKTSLRMAALTGVAALAGALGMPSDAEACGGCFAPTGSPTVVTRHQMAVALSPEQTTLWDQIEYAGDPEDFVWVLPVRDGAPVELADNAFFEALEQATRITLQAPTPPRTFCPDPCGGLSAGAESDFGAADAGRGGVEVHHQATIGPYETVTIGSEDPDALVTWLRDRDYAVPDSILPTIRFYTDQGMDFAVLRLAPDAGVNQMQPVRVSMPGMNPTFPLRMVAAGVEGKVGLELFVFGEGRYEAENFAMAEVDRDAITYDWATGRFSYDDLLSDALATEDGRVWVTEFAQIAPDSIRYYESYDPETGETHSAMDDYQVVLRNLPSPYLTRLVSDMPARHLTEDLILQASTGGDLGNFINVTRELNRAEDVTCTEVCTDPYAGESGSGVGWRSGGRGDGLCSASPGRTAPAFGLLVLAGVGLAFWTRRRRR
jgi:MYXO-CTERM domain-containing protein